MLSLHVHRRDTSIATPRYQYAQNVEACTYTLIVELEIRIDFTPLLSLIMKASLVMINCTRSRRTFEFGSMNIPFEIEWSNYTWTRTSCTLQRL